MNKRVLFADDELHIIEALIETIKVEGYEIFTCNTVVKALALVRDREFGCVIIDIMMEPGPGLESVDPSKAGLFAIDEMQKIRKHQSIICHSVIGDVDIIERLKKKNVLYLRKGETSLNKASRLIISKITGTYSAR